MSGQKPNGELAFTGERVVPGKTPAFLLLEHVARYRFAAQFAAGRMILDAGCGAGYGAALLAEHARLVVGIDPAEVAARYARENYARANLHFARADCRRLSFANGSFDLVVLFEVLEHVAGQDECLDEIRRVLRAEGVFLLSTPNAARATKAIEEENPFHCKELSESELGELLRRHFRHVQILYQHETSGTAIEAPGAAGNAEVVEDSSGSQAPKYLIAACGARPFTVPRGRIVSLGGIDHQIAVVRDLRQTQAELGFQQQEIEARGREIEARGQALTAQQQEIEARGREIEVREEAIEAHQREIEIRGRALDELRSHVQGLIDQREEILKEHAKNIAAHQGAIRTLENHVAALAARLREEVEARDRQIADLGKQNEAQRMELAWLYKWMPFNKLARRFLYGKNLSRRLPYWPGQRR